MQIDWKHVVVTCQKHLKRSEIARRCSMPYSTLSDIAQGRTTEPKGTHAVLLYDLYRSLT